MASKQNTLYQALYNIHKYKVSTEVERLGFLGLRHSVWDLGDQV